MTEHQIRNKQLQFSLPVIFLVIGLTIWQYLVTLLHIPSLILSTPTEVFYFMVGSVERLYSNSLITFYEVISGFIGGIATGLIFAIAVFYVKFLRRTVYPILIALDSMPKIALAPVLTIWFATGIEYRLLTTVLIAFFPMVVNSIDGFRRTDERLVDLFQIYCSNRLMELYKLRLPSSLPYIMAGIRNAVILSIIGAVTAEILAGSGGLGYLLVIGQKLEGSELVFSALACLLIIGFALFGAVWGLERSLKGRRYL